MRREGDRRGPAVRGPGRERGDDGGRSDRDRTGAFHALRQGRGGHYDARMLQGMVREGDVVKVRTDDFRHTIEDCPPSECLLRIEAVHCANATGLLVEVAFCGCRDPMTARPLEEAFVRQVPPVLHICLEPHDGKQCGVTSEGRLVLHTTRFEVVNEPRAEWYFREPQATPRRHASPAEGRVVPGSEPRASPTRHASPPGGRVVPGSDGHAPPPIETDVARPRQGAEADIGAPASGQAAGRGGAPPASELRTRLARLRDKVAPRAPEVERGKTPQQQQHQQQQQHARDVDVREPAQGVAVREPVQDDGQVRERHERQRGSRTPPARPDDVGALLARRAEQHVRAPQRDRSHGSRRRHRRKRRRSSSPSSSTGTRQEDFRDARGSEGPRQPRDVARRAPGRLLKEALAKMTEYLVTQQPGEGRGEEMKDVAMTYLTSVLVPTMGTGLNERSRRELTTLATALDHMVCGRIAEAGDLLVQRFKAVELAATTGSWGVAQHLEIAPPSQVSAVHEKEIEAAAKLERHHFKLRQALAHGNGRGARGHGGR